MSSIHLTYNLLDLGHFIKENCTWFCDERAKWNAMISEYIAYSNLLGVDG